jgi:hypothetical protein
MQAITMRRISSPRAILMSALRRLDLAPAVLIIAGISFVVHVLVGKNYGVTESEQ